MHITCVCMHPCMHACVCVCVCARARVHACVCVSLPVCKCLSVFTIVGRERAARTASDAMPWEQDTSSVHRTPWAVGRCDSTSQCYRVPRTIGRHGRTRHVVHGGWPCCTAACGVMLVGILRARTCVCAHLRTCIDACVGTASAWKGFKESA